MFDTNISEVSLEIISKTRFVNSPENHQHYQKMEKNHKSFWL